jgi:hypothetical protein
MRTAAIVPPFSFYGMSALGGTQTMHDLTDSASRRATFRDATSSDGHPSIRDP